MQIGIGQPVRIGHWQSLPFTLLVCVVLRCAFVWRQQQIIFSPLCFKYCACNFSFTVSFQRLCPVCYYCLLLPEGIPSLTPAHPEPALEWHTSSWLPAVQLSPPACFLAQPVPVGSLFSSPWPKDSSARFMAIFLLHQSLISASEFLCGWVQTTSLPNRCAGHLLCMESLLLYEWMWINSKLLL